ncbi:MAG: collagen-like protein, partial [Fibrobacter sp.]|nr:collagen-like protein [Fibrobacter sp.]
MKPTNATCLSFLTCDALSLSKCLGISLSIAFLFSACGENTTTEKIVEVAGSGVEVVTDVSLLPPCSATNEGELVWVRNEATPRMCSAGLWYAIAEGSVAATCSTQPLLDGSGIKILCGGDSIGVVLNGKDGAQGIQGKPGVQGKQGVAGKDGADGKDGEDGADGND